uniref:Glucosyltransferase 3-like C-terminal domain-containing protein n=1 Tax=candidate division WOR-3 bacterium TaxID=2052148 RepID=A0A7C4YHT7_UNCW3
MKNILLFTGLEGTGRDSLAYNNFIRPIGGNVLSFIDIKDILKGNFYRRSFIFPIIGIPTHPDKIRFILFKIQAIFYMILILPFIKKKEIFVRGIPVAFILSLFKFQYRLFLPGIYSKEGKVYNGIDENFLRYIERRAIINSKIVYVPDEEIKDFIISNYGYKNIKVVYIPVDTDYFKTNKKKGKNIVYLGTIPDKETEMNILKTFKAFRDYRDMKLFILSRNKLEGFHSFYVKRDRLNDILNEMDIGLVMEGGNENSRYLLTTKFVEYAASGIPVIVHKDIIALKKIVEENRLGIVVDPERISDEEIIGFFKEYDLFAKNIRRFAEEKLSYKVFRERVLND